MLMNRKKTVKRIISALCCVTASVCVAFSSAARTTFAAEEDDGAVPYGVCDIYVAEGFMKGASLTDGHDLYATVLEDRLELEFTGADPWVNLRPSSPVGTDAYPVLAIDAEFVRAAEEGEGEGEGSGAAGSLYYSAQGETHSEERRVAFTVENASGRQWIPVFLNDRGPLAEIRLDMSDDPAGDALTGVNIYSIRFFDGLFSWLDFLYGSLETGEGILELSDANAIPYVREGAVPGSEKVYLIRNSVPGQFVVSVPAEAGPLAADFGGAAVTLAAGESRYIYLDAGCVLAALTAVPAGGEAPAGEENGAGQGEGDTDDGNGVPDGDANAPGGESGGEQAPAVLMTVERAHTALESRLEAREKIAAAGSGIILDYYDVYDPEAYISLRGEDGSDTVLAGVYGAENEFVKDGNVAVTIPGTVAEDGTYKIVLCQRDSECEAQVYVYTLKDGEIADISTRPGMAGEVRSEKDSVKGALKVSGSVSARIPVERIAVVPAGEEEAAPVAAALQNGSVPAPDGAAEEGTFAYVFSLENALPGEPGDYSYSVFARTADGASVRIGTVSVNVEKIEVPPVTEDIPGTGPETDPGTDPGPSTDPEDNPGTGDAPAAYALLIPAVSLAATLVTIRRNARKKA